MLASDREACFPLFFSILQSASVAAAPGLSINFAGNSRTHRAGLVQTVLRVPGRDNHCVGIIGWRQFVPERHEVEKVSVMENNKKDSRPMSESGNETRTAKPATKIRIIEDAEATGETAAAYDFWRAGSGRQQVPGIIKCFGARPDFLRRVIEFGNTVHFSEGHLSRRYKELIASYVSYLNRCPY